MAHDINNNPLNEKDLVLFPLGTGQLVPAVVEKINSGLLTAENKQGQPTVELRLMLAVPVLPNGLVPGLVKIGEGK